MRSKVPVRADFPTPPATKLNRSVWDSFFLAWPGNYLPEQLHWIGASKKPGIPPPVAQTWTKDRLELVSQTATELVWQVKKKTHKWQVSWIYGAWGLSSCLLPARETSVPVILFELNHSIYQKTFVNQRKLLGSYLCNISTTILMQWFDHASFSISLLIMNRWEGME
jgi:hypothetical protein